MVNRVVPRAELDAAALKFARRMALIAPEALVGTKLALNRGADAAGFRNAIRAGLDMVAPLYAARTEVGNEVRRDQRKGRPRRGPALARRPVRGVSPSALGRLKPRPETLTGAAAAADDRFK